MLRDPPQLGTQALPGEFSVKVGFGSSAQEGQCPLQVTLGTNHTGYMQASSYYSFLIISDTIFPPSQFQFRTHNL